MSKHLERRVCVCGKEYLFGGAYEETVCPGCWPAHKGFKREPDQAERLRAWRIRLGLDKQKQETTAA